jgi:hypothetical protein
MSLQDVYPCGLEESATFISHFPRRYLCPRAAGQPLQLFMHLHGGHVRPSKNMACKGLADSLKAKATHGFKHVFCGSFFSVSLLRQLFALCFGHFDPSSKSHFMPPNGGYNCAMITVAKDFSD